MIAKQCLQDWRSWKFLGTMAGNPFFIDTKEFHQNTYVRQYEAFGGSDDLRYKISKVGHDKFGEGYKLLGEEYGYAPLWMYYGKTSNSISTMQGGGFFHIVKTLDKEEANLNCFAYALSTYGKLLEKVAGRPMQEIQESVKLNIDHIVEKYFQGVKEPLDGDLVIYQTLESVNTLSGITIGANTNTHAGIYRETKPNWNSPCGGSVESKWGWLCNAYIFQHDVFFVPHFYGSIAKFYRLKESENMCMQIDRE